MAKKRAKRRIYKSTRPKAYTSVRTNRRGVARYTRPVPRYI